MRWFSGDTANRPRSRRRPCLVRPFPRPWSKGDVKRVWVLESVYGFDREALAHVVVQILEDEAFRFDDSDRLRRVLKRFKAGKADFSDYLIHSVAESEGLILETFDQKLRK